MDIQTRELPNFIYVSELVRTWETAVLLVLLSLLNKILTLYISPFLRESGPIDFPSDNPGDLKEQVKEFVRFIALLRELKKTNIDDILNLIPEKFNIILKHFDGAFLPDFIASIEKPEGVILEIVDGGIQIYCNFSEVTELPSRLDSSKAIIAKMFKAIQVDTSSMYVPYSDTPSESTLVFPPASGVRDVGSMDKPSTPPGSLADFVGWYNNLEPKPYSNGGIVTAVSHSGTMKTFVESVKSVNSPPSPSFKTEYDIAIGTNTCSLVFKNDNGQTFNIFRHAYSCDNRNMHKGKHLQRMGDAGKYASLSLWGILSTLKFSSEKMQSLITDQEVDNPPGLKICRGMDKESEEYLKSEYNSMNVLCGEQRDRMPIGNFSLSLGHCGTSGGLLPTFDNNCIRIITDPKGPKVVLYLDKEKKNIEARFFKSAETSTTYEKEMTQILKLQTLNNALYKIIEWLASDVNITLELENELMESIKLFINNDEAIKPRWEIAFNTLYTGFVDQQRQLMEQQRHTGFVDQQRQLREQQQERWRQQQQERRRKQFDMPVKNTAAFEKPNILDETKCIKITANKDTDKFTLDLVNCASPTYEPGAKSNFALLFLDKNEHKIECKLFEYNKFSGINFSFDNEQFLGTYLVNILTGLGITDKEKQKLLKSELIESIKTFIESNTEIDHEWEELLTPLYESYIEKKAAKAGVGAGVGVETASEFSNLPIQEPLGVSVNAGGTNKRTRRHRKHKVMKKCTRKHKKYNPRRKSRRIQKRKQTHKRKSCKSRKSRKSRK